MTFDPFYFPPLPKQKRDALIKETQLIVRGVSMLSPLLIRRYTRVGITYYPLKPANQGKTLIKKPCNIELFEDYQEIMKPAPLEEYQAFNYASKVIKRLLNNVVRDRYYFMDVDSIAFTVELNKNTHTHLQDLDNLTTWLKGIGQLHLLDLSKN